MRPMLCRGCGSYAVKTGRRKGGSHAEVLREVQLRLSCRTSPVDEDWQEGQNDWAVVYTQWPTQCVSLDPCTCVRGKRPLQMGPDEKKWLWGSWTG